MRAFVLSLCVFSLVLTGVVLCGVFSARAIDRTSEELAALPVPSGDAADLSAAVDASARLRENWSRRARFVSLTLNHEDMMQLSAALAQLEGAARADDRKTYVATLTVTADALRHLRSLAVLTPGSVL